MNDVDPPLDPTPADGFPTGSTADPQPARLRLGPDDPRLGELKARAQLCEPLVRVGHQGVTESLIKTVSAALDQHELVKIRFTAMKEQKRSLSRVIEQLTNSVMVQRVGHTATYWRPRKS